MMLAHDFAEKGITTIRFDKRGVSESIMAYLVKNPTTNYDIAVEDAHDWVSYFKSYKSQSKCIWLLGIHIPNTNTHIVYMYIYIFIYIY